MANLTLSTSQISATSATCTSFYFLPKSEQEFLLAAQKIEIYVATVYLPLILLGLLENGVSIIALVLLLRWKNPAKKYYILITIINLAISLENDLLAYFPHLLSISSYYILGPEKLISISLVKDSNVVFCKGLDALDSVLMLELMWMVVLLNLNRVLMIVFPFKGLTISKIFRNRCLAVAILFISLFGLHNLHCAYYYSLQGAIGVCLNLIETTLADAFWQKYDSFVRMPMQTFIPTAIILICTVIIFISLMMTMKQRAEMSCRGKPMDFKAIRILFTLSVIYFAAVLPGLICDIAKSLFTNCFDKNVVLYSFLTTIKALILNQLTILLRVLDPLVFYFMIPQFKNKVRQILCSNCRNRAEKLSSLKINGKLSSNLRK